MPKLDAKVALVTGGTSGIGLAATKALAKEGAHAYITGRREQELATAVQQIGENATGVRGDVSNAGDLDRLYTQIKSEKQSLDVLFANAGIAKYAVLGNITEELFDSFFNVNVKGVLYGTESAPADA
jgi:NAD(P)-dependent dehydrogenase (short-subunit alcohol dehydrogenase family)